MSNILVKRLIVIYGEPESIDPKAYLEEIENLTNGYGTDTLTEAANDLLSTHRFKTWPTPAQCVQACHLAAERQATRKPPKQYKFPSKRGPYDPVTVENWRKAQEWRNSLPDNHPLVRQGNAFQAAIKPIMRDVFEAMQRNSPNRALHAKPLTERSRRMQGDDA